jgi:cytoskeletal protein CcmA (bactofilin family)
MMKKLLWASLLVLTLLVSTAAPALAAGPLDGQVVFGGTFTLEADEVLDGDLVVFGGDVTLEMGSRVDGDVAVLSGSADVAGTVEGDVAVFGGNVDLASTAVVDGELVNIGGSIDREEGAIVRGNQVEGLAFDSEFRFPTFARVWTNGYRYNWDNWLLRFFIRALKALATVVLITVIAALVAIFLPQPLERVSQAVLVAPAHSWAVGFVTAILAALIGVTLAATICLLPFGGLVFLAALIAGVFGWTALGLIVGLRVLEQLNARNVTPAMGAMVGGVILSSIAAAIWIVSDCCLGWPFVVLVGSFGLGAVVLTRFGRREYVPSQVAEAAPVPVVEDEPEFTPVEEPDEAPSEPADDAVEPSGG